MKDFVLYNPTKILFGYGVLRNCGEEAKSLGKKSIIITGKTSAKRTGVLDKVVGLLKENNIDTIVYSKITPNPKVEEVDEAAKIAKENNCDFVIGLGGGSAMDAAKGVAIVAKNGGSIWDYIPLATKKAKPFNEVLPIMMIPTLAATSSEVNCAAVFTNLATNQKAAIVNPLIYPKISIVDPLLTITVPRKQTAEGVIDIIMHVLEEYLTGDENCDLQDRITEGIIVTCIENAKVLMQEPQNVIARTNISFCSLVALHGFPNAGRSGVWNVHQVEHAITGLFDNISHGSGIAAVLPAYLKFLSQKRKNKVIQLAINVFGLDKNLGDEKLVDGCIEKFKEFINSIGLSTDLKSLGIKREDFGRIVDNLYSVSGVNEIIGNKENVIKILELAYE
jgi:alcohol dehydrogenase YqhD (iron-dependent ADH family)